MITPIHESKDRSAQFREVPSHVPLTAPAIPRGLMTGDTPTPYEVSTTAPRGARAYFRNVGHTLHLDTTRGRQTWALGLALLGVAAAVILFSRRSSGART